MAAVYASHILGVPFIPYGSKAPAHLGSLLIIDTAMESGATLRKAGRWWFAHGGQRPFPKDMMEWLEGQGELASMAEIQVKPDGKY